MSDELTLTLSSPITEEEWDLISDVDFDHTDRIWFNTKHGKKVEFVKIPRWIPCSERLPEDDSIVLVYYNDPREEVLCLWLGWHEMDNVWYIDGNAHSSEYGNEVIAWMPLPAPYTEAPT